MSKTTMYRKVGCLACGYVQVDAVSYYRHKKAWDTNHTLEYCRTRRNHPAVIGKMSDPAAKIETQRKEN